MAPRTRYAMVVTTAVVGAGVVAFGAGSILPQQTDGTTAALDKVNSFSDGDTGGGADAIRSVSTERASRAQRRAGSPVPKTVPQWIRPAAGPISSLFAMRWGVMHKGVDIAAGYGSTVRAASAGVVKLAGWDGGYGKLVIIEHENGITTRYGHNSKLLVKAGQHVEAGQAISLVGSTGYSTGPHCHFEVRRGDVAIDPMPFMRERGVDLYKDINTSL
jgi:murein DD-endopeptidase MepM/ murein hydrolase activator NlpD